LLEKAISIPQKKTLMSNKPLDLYISPSAYSYEGVYQILSKIPATSMFDQSKLVFGAALVEVIQHKKFKDIKAHVIAPIHNLFTAGKRDAFLDLLRKVIQGNYAKVVTVPVEEDLLNTKIESAKLVK